MMTPQEHTLLIAMLAQQGHVIQVLFDLLRAKGVVEGDDADAFEFARRADPVSRAQVVDALMASYRQKAKQAGVHLDF